MNSLFSAVCSIDFSILDFIQSVMRHHILDAVMVFITHLGSAGILWIILTLILLCTKKHRKTGIVMALSLIFSLLFSNIILKNLTARPRPFELNAMADIIIQKPTDFSFPSGHTSSSFAAAFSVLLCRLKPLTPFAIITASLIAFSRLYLYVHFPTDVIAGIILGFVYAVSAFAVINAIYARRGK